MTYLTAISWTLAIEVPVVVALLVPRPALLRALGTVVLANLVTHPVVWMVLDGMDHHFWTVFTAVEVAAWLIEAAVISVAWPRAARQLVLPVALVANGLSCLAGLLAYAV